MRNASSRKLAHHNLTYGEKRDINLPLQLVKYMVEKKSQEKPFLQSY